MDWAPWIVGPLVGAVIGYVTNRVAVMMVFRLIPGRQAEIAKKIGDVVGTELVGDDDLVALLDGLDLRPGVTEMIERTLTKRLGEIASFPVLGSVLTKDRIDRIRDGIVDSILERKSFFVDVMRTGFERSIDLRALVREKVAALPTERLQSSILEVARRELFAIQLLCAALGGVIGLLQAALLSVLG